MKHLQVILFLGFLLISTNSFAAVISSIIVSGSNDPLINGTYIYDTVFNGKASWTKGDYVLRWSTGVMGLSWNIENPTTVELYYSNWDNTVVPPESFWSCQAHSVPPCTPPVVTEDPLPEALIVSGTVDTFLNGEYTRGLNYNNFPRYTMGNFEIHVEAVWTNPWIIENTTTSNQYYTNSNNGVNVPEYGWSQGTHAGLPVSPPVVTESKLPNQYYVSGAGFSGVNGIYTRTINSTSHTGLVYDKEATYFLRAGGFGPMELGYGITNIGGGSYYYVVSNSLVIPSIGWALDFLGSTFPPPPFVIPYNFPWPMFMPSITVNAKP